MTAARQSAILYVDPFSGVAGDMFLGALLDLGLDLEGLKARLSKLHLHGYRLASRRVMRGPIAAVKFDVETETAGHGHTHGHEHQTLAGIEAIIKEAPFSERVKADSLKVFQKLAEAEGRIHNRPPEQVSFHETGAVDSLVDIIGSCLGLEMLGISEVWCGPVAVGKGGFVQCRHGQLPLPAPAALELLKGIPIHAGSGPDNTELTTPTGAALLAALASGFGPMPPMTIAKIGYGAGTNENAGVPNVLRVLMGAKTDASEASSSSDSILEIQTNLDDTPPEILGYLAETLLAAGALDVFFSPIQMKKFRPGVMLTILAEPARLDALSAILFKECSTFGLRYRLESRLKLSRRIIQVETQYGPVKVKIGSWLGEETSVHPEFDDCQALARKNGVPVKLVLEAARRACAGKK